jgi:Fe-S cluster biogenesis protein NfuA
MADITDEDRQLRERMRRIESLLQEVERFKDAHAQAKTREIVQCLMDVHGAVFERMLGHINDSKLTGNAMIDSLAEDDSIASLMLLYGLHPLDLETRVRQALEKGRPYLQSHGGNVELLSVEDGVVRLHLQGSCHGCPSSAVTLKSTIEEAIMEKAPDAVSIVVEGEVEGESAPAVFEDKHHFALPILAG